MGVDNLFDEEYRFKFFHNTLRDNISLFDEDMLRQINDIIVEYGHIVVKKKKISKSKSIAMQ
jgi:hypothetical protein